MDDRTKGRVEGLQMILDYCRNIETIGPKYARDLTPEESEWWDRNVTQAPGLFYFETPGEAEEIIAWMIERERGDAG